jgi:hypothetical protein
MLRERVYPLNKGRTKFVKIFLDENLTPKVKLVACHGAESNTVVHFNDTEGPYTQRCGS